MTEEKQDSIQLEITEIERRLLIQTIETSTYPGKFSKLVAGLLERLGAQPEEDDDPR